MDLSINKKMRCGVTSLSHNETVEDDELSQYSLSSYNNLLHTVSDAEPRSPVSVRDMVRRYDEAAKMQNRRPLLPRSKSPVKKVGLHTKISQSPEDTDKWASLNNKRANVIRDSNQQDSKSCSIMKEDADSSPLNRSRHASFFENDDIYIADHTKRTSSSPIRETETVDTNPGAIAKPDIIESSYESKTTIAKTSSGVRIIIDIFFDKEHQPVSAADVIGSRIETGIPESRILDEFQECAAITGPPLLED